MKQNYAPQLHWRLHIMRIAFQFSKVATLVVLLSLSLAFVAWGQDTITAYFEGSGSLSTSSWSAGDSLVQNGNLHSTAKLTATKQIALYKTSPYNQVQMQWAPAGDGCDDAGTAYAGIVFLNTGSNAGNGYYCYYYSGQIRLYTIVAGAIGTSKGSLSITGAPTMAAGSTFKVYVNTATNQFDYYLNGTLLGSLTDGAKTYGLSSSCYAGALLYGGKSNDIEEMTFYYVAPTSDTTAPSAATITATAASSSSITVAWTAQSDDGGSSGSGAATSYDLRYNTATITSSNFATSTRVTTSTPKAPGSAESYTVTGLSASTKYYFALVIKDEVPNSSALSNIASATTSAGSGGGGGGTPSLGWNSPITDDFGRASLGSDWSAPKFVIESNELAISSSNGYGLAAFARSGANKSAGADSIKLSMTMGASAVYYQSSNYIPVGFAMMLESASSSANGYWLRRSSNKLSLYQITGGGATFNTLIGETSVTKTAPAAGQKVTAIIKVSGTALTIHHYIDDAFDGTLNVTLPSAPGDTWYVGVAMYEDGASNFNVDNYSVYLPNLGSASATRIAYVSGNNQSAPINQYVADSLKVRVTDDAGNPVSNVVVDFAVTQGKGTTETGTFDGKIWKEVELGTLGVPIAKDTTVTTASGGHAIKTSYTAGYRYKTAVTIPIYNPEERTYFFYLRARTTSTSRNTLIIKYNTNDSLYMDFADVSGAWAWQKHATSFKLAKGLQTIRLVIYEPGWEWDKIALIGTGLSGPSGSTTGDTGPNLSNITNSSGYAAARLKFGTDADTSVIVSSYGYKADGTTLLTGAPVNFTLDPTPGPAVSMIKDPDLTDPILGTRDETAGATLIADILDSYGNGVPGTTVNWSLISGVGGSLASSTSTSDEFGKARVTMTLGLVDTLFTVQAAAVGAGGGSLTNSPLTFTIKTGKPPASMSKVSGDGQSGTVGSTLPTQLKVKVLGSTGANYPNYPVTFTVKTGDGKVSTASAPTQVSSLKVLTDSNGEASVYLTLGDKPGANTVEAKLQGLSSIPTQTFTATGVKGVASVLAIVSGNNQTGSIGLPMADSLVVKVTDLRDNGIAGHAVVFNLIDGTNAYFETAGVHTVTRYTNGSGRAAVLMTMGSAVGEVHTVRATATGLTPEYVTFTGTATEPVASRIEYFSGNNQDTTVTAKLAKPFVVKVYGPYNTVISGHSVRFRVVKGGGNFDGLNEKVVTSDISGLASANLTLGKTAGDSANVIEVVSYRVDQPTTLLDGSPIRLWANGRPGPAAKLVKLATTDNQTGSNGAELPLPIKAQVTDVYGNPISGHSITFQIVGSGGTFVDTDGESTVKTIATGDDGYSSVRWKMPVALGTVQVRVDALRNDGAALTDSPATFTATSVTGDAYKMVKWFTPDTLKGMVGNALSQNVKVRITDSNDMPKTGYMVTFTATQGGGKVNGATYVTVPTSADSGIAQVTWTLGTASGTANNVIEVRAGVVVNPLLVFKASAAPDVPYQLVPDAATNNQLGKVGQPLSKAIKVQVKDKYGNGVPNSPVLFHVSGVDSLRGNIGGLVESTINTDLDGNAAVYWILGKRPGSKNNAMEVSARYNNTNLTNSPFIFYASAVVGDPKLMHMVSDTANFTGRIGNMLPELLKVRVTDEFKNPIANHSVTFTVMSKVEANGGSLDGTVNTTTTKNTDSNGLVSAQFYLGMNAGNKINRIEASAEYSGLKLTGSPIVFLISGTHTNAENLALAGGDGQTGTVGRFLGTELAVLARDVYNNPVKGHPIQFRIIVGASDFAALGTDTLLTKVVETGADGIARVKWRLGRTAGMDRNVVEATSTNGTAALRNSPIRFTAISTPDMTDGKRSKILAVDAVVNADGQTKASIKVSLRDKYENPVTGKYVTLLSNDATTFITQPLSTTDVNGDAVGFATSTKAGKKWIKARDVNNNISIADSVMVTFLPLGAYEIARPGSNDGDAQTRNVGTALPLPLRVVVRDRNGNPIANHAVTFVPTQGGGTMIDPQVVYTDSTGVAQARYKLGSTAGVNFVEARAVKSDGSGTALSNSPVRFTEVAVVPSPAKLVIVSGDNQSAAPGRQLPQLFKVQLEDVSGWPVANVQVKFSVLVNNGAITSTNPVLTDMYGQATAQAVAGTGQGNTLYSAGLPAYGAIGAVTFTATTLPGSASKIVYLSGGDQTGTVGRTLYTPLSVQVEDDYGNAVPNWPVMFTVVDDGTVDGKGTLDGGMTTLSVTSNSQGITSASYTLGTRAGVNKVRASAVNLNPAYIEFEVYGEADYAYTMDKVETTLYGQVADTMKFPIQVLVKDRYDNPARGGTVSFVVVPGSGSIAGPSLVTSGANGLASARWVLGKQGTNEALATASLPSGSPTVRFYARGDIQNYPKFSILSSYTIDENEQLRFSVIATDKDGDQIYYSANNLPDGATFEIDGSNIYWFTWTPNFDQGGQTYVPVFTAQDNQGGIDIDSVRIIVTNENRAPRVVATEPAAEVMSIKWGMAQTFSVQVEDPDNDPVYYTWKVLNQSVSSSSSYTFDSRYYPMGSYVISLDIYDATHTINKTWLITVTSVELKSFTCSSVAYQGITLTWATTSENDNMGFNILRSRSEKAAFEKINSELIAPRPDGQYSWIDNTAKAGERYYYKLEDISRSGQATQHGPVSADMPVPQQFDLAQNYPNPFNPVTNIRFQLPAAGKVLLQVFNTNGQLIRTLVDGEVAAGYHQILWDARNDAGAQVVTGVYYYRILTHGMSVTKKMALLK
jgi:hypothetical protein